MWKLQPVLPRIATTAGPPCSLLVAHQQNHLGVIPTSSCTYMPKAAAATDMEKWCATKYEHDRCYVHVTDSEQHSIHWQRPVLNPHTRHAMLPAPHLKRPLTPCSKAPAHLSKPSLSKPCRSYPSLLKPSLQQCNGFLDQPYQPLVVALGAVCHGTQQLTVAQFIKTRSRGLAFATCTTFCKEVCLFAFQVYIARRHSRHLRPQTAAKAVQ